MLVFFIERLFFNNKQYFMYLQRACQVKSVI